MPGDDLSAINAQNVTIELKSLKQQRGQLKAKLSRLKTFVYETYSNGECIEQLQIRLEKNEQLLEQFEAVQLRIDVLEYADETGSDLQEFEEGYYEVFASARKLVAKINVSNAPTSNESSGQISSLNRDTARLKLPPLTLPTFGGNYEKWSTFKDSFVSAVDSDDRLSDVQKFQYLRGCLTGEALTLISNLETTNQNYKIAWESLVDRFQNKRLIIHSHIKALLDAPSITKETQTNLRQFVDSIQTQLRALEAWQVPVNHWDIILIHLFTSKLDYFTRKEWESEISKQDGDYLPHISDLLKFLNNKCRMLEMVEKNKPHQSTVKSVGPFKKVANIATAVGSCNYCRNPEHMIYKCKEFLDFTADKRIEEARRLNLCLNCLRTGHETNSCKLLPCRICKRYHNSLLHKNSRTHGPIETNRTDRQLATISNFAEGTNASYVLLATACLDIKDASGIAHRCTALLDPGSQMSFVTYDLCQKLKLETQKIDVNVSGINQHSSRVTQKTKVNISSRVSDFETSLECLVVPKITETLPQLKLDFGALQVPKHIELADESFSTPKSIDLLIGAELFWELLGEGRRRLGDTGIILQQTKLGWVASGRTYNLLWQTGKVNFNGFSQLDYQLQRFWESEEIPDEEIYSNEERNCEEHFIRNVDRDQDGRYKVALPIKDVTSVLGDSREMAHKRLIYLERRLQKDPELMSEYKKFLEEYKNLGHMKQINECVELSQTYYLPHHPVIKSDSLTTRLRVVFDASAKTSSNCSLNDILMVGPKTQSDLFDIVLRFRFYPIVLTADISMMYRQIKVRDEDQRLQRVLWRDSQSHEIVTYQLTTVTYGTSSAPFLATRCLKQLAIDEEQNFPEAARILRSDFYMDDLLTGANSSEEGSLLREQLSKLLERGKFKLRKWRSNCPEALDFQNEDTDSLLILDKDATMKTLGLFWNAKEDNLQFVIKLEKDNHMTKRSILGRISRIFDPMGLLGPIVITAKIFLQQLWLARLDWDEPIPDNLKSIWIEYYEQLETLNDIHIPRRVHLGRLEDVSDIIAFCDASEKAYGACIYIQNVNSIGESSTRLLCSKSKVAPLKTVTLPRLELNGAHLLCKLLKNVKRALGRKIRNVYCFTDSTIVLAWIRTEPNVLKTYVANRVAEIQRITNANDWYHVPSKMNPADLLSRGCLASSLKESQLWWNGPDFLHNNEFPNQDMKIPDTLPEFELRNITLTVVENDTISSLIAKCSSWLKLKRVIGYCFRFYNNCKNKHSRQDGALTVLETEYSSGIIIQLVQRQMFHIEFHKLLDGRPIKKKSQLLQLNPFLDEKGCLRVGGRIGKASISEDHKHPIILPRHRLTWLILEDYHIKFHHAGVDVILAQVRTKFWPIGGRSFTKRIVKACLKCYRIRPQPLEQLMGNLPEFRVEPTIRPFLHTGIDFAGPINLKESKRRGRPITSKAYVAVFVCLVTRAVHLECVTELTTQAFMATLRRFIARRGLCSIICSDNGTNFVGANRDLKKVYEFLRKNNDEMITDTANRQINWKFIPPRSPHFGGMHEAAVKSFKRHFYKVTQGILLTFEECCTLLAEIEVCLNSRPLTKLSDDPNDMSVLTPSHFLIGDTPRLPLEYNLLEGPINLLKRWQHLQRIRQHFWQRWQREYLHQLQTRSKWHVATENPRIGELVLIAEDNLPPLRWALGRIIELHPGEDGLVRVVSVRTKVSVLKRPITKICLLPKLDSP